MAVCFAFFSAQKSRPDASKSAYVTDGVRDGLRVCLGKHFTRWLQPSRSDQSLAELFFVIFYSTTSIRHPATWVSTTRRQVRAVSTSSTVLPKSKATEPVPLCKFPPSPSHVP